MHRVEAPRPHTGTGPPALHGEEQRGGGLGWAGGVGGPVH